MRINDESIESFRVTPFTDLVQAAVIVFVLPLAFLFIMTAVRLLYVYWADRTEFERNRARTGSWADLIRGTTPTTYDGVRDETVVAGVAVDINTHEWVEQGKLSEEAVVSVLR